MIEKKVKELKGDFSVDKQPFVVGDTNQHIKEMLKEEQVEMVVDSDDSGMGDADWSTAYINYHSLHIINTGI